MAVDLMAAGATSPACVAPSRANQNGPTPDRGDFESELANWSDPAADAPATRCGPGTDRKGDRDPADKPSDPALSGTASTLSAAAAALPAEVAPLPDPAASSPLPSPAQSVDGGALLAQSMLLPRDLASSLPATDAGTGMSNRGTARAGGPEAVSPADGAPAQPTLQSRGEPAQPLVAAVDPSLPVATAAPAAALPVAQGEASSAPDALRSLARDLTAVDGRVPRTATGEVPAPGWQAHAQARAQALEATQAAVQRLQGQQQAGPEALAQRTLVQAAGAMDNVSVSAEALAQAALALTATPQRRAGAGDERGAGALAGPTGNEAGLAAAPSPGWATPSMEGAAATAGAAGANPANEQLMEQVSWWLSQKTQGAQLTLDVPGGSPVSVSIQVQGNEAQIAFRSDQPEARQVLTQSLPQLKEMLGAEGLLLSGASVGGGQDRQHQRPPDAQRHGAGGLVGTMVDVAAAPARRVAQGRLDLYV